jgi:ParB family chromosome partitioning protein
MTVRPVRKPTGLGRGLASLIPQRVAESPGLVEIPLSRVRPNPRQPRTRINETDLNELAASITEHGVIQPILVTETLDGYQVVAGERRVRAAMIAGLERIPAVVRQLADREQLELALVENLQRQDLGPIEEATAYRQLIDEFGFTQEELAQRVSRARSTVANTLRLLDLAPAIQEAVADGTITEGHARAIASVADGHQGQLLSMVAARGLSVRQTEELARRLREAATTGAGAIQSRAGRPLDAELERVEEDLRRALGTKVSLARSRRGGRIVIEYYGDEELARLYERLTGGMA